MVKNVFEPQKRRERFRWRRKVTFNREEVTGVYDYDEEKDETDSQDVSQDSLLTEICREISLTGRTPHPIIRARSLKMEQSDSNSTYESFDQVDLNIGMKMTKNTGRISLKW